MTRVQLGIRMTGIYVKSRPDTEEIIGEVEAATRTETGSNSSGFIADDLVIKASRPPGYKIDTLDERGRSSPTCAASLANGRSCRDGFRQGESAPSG